MQYEEDRVSMKHTDDTERVRAAQAGNEKAFGDLVTAHHRSIA